MAEIDVGIEALNIYGGKTYLDVYSLFRARGLDLDRFDNLMMKKKAVGLPCEDSITHAVNAAKPIIDMMSEEDRNSIDLLITATESGIDFGKSLSTYVHEYLGLSRNCRLFEVKQACYAGTAALQMAASHVRENPEFDVRALVIATDSARASAKMTYAEPSQGIGAAAMLVSRKCDTLILDRGANGFYSYEVMDTCRPEADIETGDPDLSLLSYLQCLEGAYENYVDKVDGVDFQDSFHFLAFHTPFAGMVKGAHRKMMRTLKKLPFDEISVDFEKRVGPSLDYCVQVGNVYSATVYHALCSLIDCADISEPRRIGVFSYGSGCSSEFFSGVVTPASKKKLSRFNIKEALESRLELSVEDYDEILNLNMQWGFGIKNQKVDIAHFGKAYSKQFDGRGLLTLKGVTDYHREYGWS